MPCVYRSLRHDNTPTFTEDVSVIVPLQEMEFNRFLLENGLDLVTHL